MKATPFHFSTALSLFHSPLLPPVFLCWTKAHLWCQSQHGWQWSIWWHSQVEMNTLSSSLPVKHRWSAEMEIIHSGWNGPESGQNNVISIRLKLMHHTQPLAYLKIRNKLEDLKVLINSCRHHQPRPILGYTQQWNHYPASLIKLSPYITFWYLDYVRNSDDYFNISCIVV